MWFDIYRSVSGGGAQGGGETEKDKLRHKKVERRRQRMIRVRRDTEQRRLKAIHEGVKERLIRSKNMLQTNRLAKRRMSDGVLIEEEQERSRTE